ncbi:hypothetical protein K9K77_00780 [Candidatus Babeliales bacterium]|nr:hypothetical protein [Candidatus Babeliales bacterium]
MNKKIVIFLLCAAFSFSQKVFTQEILKQGKENQVKRKRERRIRRKKVIKNFDADFSNPDQSLPPLLITSNGPKNTKGEESLQFNFENQKTKADQELSLFLTEIEFTHSGIATFFSQSFNRKEYGRDFLPHNFLHFTQFLRYGNQLNQPTTFFEGVIRLFHQKLKSSTFVNAYALELMLIEATPYLEQQFPKEEKLFFWSDIKKLLWTSFKDKFSFLQKDPMAFFEDISDDIIEKVKIHVSSPDKLRSSILRFVEGNVDKVIWSPYDQLDTWTSFKNLGKAITLLHEKNIITDPYDLNDLYWGLVERYCYFLELTGTLLNEKTIATIHKDLLNNPPSWIKTEEQEQGLETKKDRLLQALVETKTKVLFSDQQMVHSLKPLVV